MNFVPYIIWTLISVKIFITDKDLDIILSLLINVVQKRPKLAKNVLNQSKNDQKVRKLLRWRCPKLDYGLLLIFLSIHALSKTYHSKFNKLILRQITSSYNIWYNVYIFISRQLIPYVQLYPTFHQNSGRL